MIIDWNHELRDQMEFAWEHQFLPRMEGLTDEEYLWQPVSDCWSVVQDSDGRWIWQIKYPDPEPSPFTTIAWRLLHMVDFLATRTSNHFGDGSYRRQTVDVPSTAEGALTLLTEAHARWNEGVASLGEAGLARPCGPAEGRFQHHSLATLVLHINREFLHHAAEVALLRDLYRDTHR